MSTTDVAYENGGEPDKYYNKLFVCRISGSLAVV